MDPETKLTKDPAASPARAQGWSQLWMGVRDILPILIGVAPFGMIYGVLAIKAGLSVGAAQAMSSILFAGSSQFMSVQLIGSGTPWLVVVITIFIINLRHALYSASVAPYMQRLSPAWKGILAYLLVDEAFAIGITHYKNSGNEDKKHWYMLGAGLSLWTCWQASTAAGIFLGAQIPARWALDFTLALTFIALVVPVLKDRSTLLAAVSAACTAVATYRLPYKLGVILAALVGIAVGLWSESKWRKSG
jgi:4-azaleucine resistance transporter AzlC